MGSKILNVILFLVVVWGIRFSWNLISIDRSDVQERTPTEWVAEDDAWIAEEVAKGVAVPANGWLGAEKHVTFEGDPNFMNEAIAKFEAAGAQQVWMVGIEKFNGAEISDTIAIELPADPAVRSQILQIEAGLFGTETTPDVGQRFVVVYFD